MEPLIVLAVTFLLLWVLFILPQQRRVRAHQAVVASLQPGDHVILSAGIYGRIVEVGPEDLTIEVAPGVELRVARQAVLRLVEDATADADDDTPSAAGDAALPAAPAPSDTVDPAADAGDGAPASTDPDPDPGSAAGPNV